MSTPTSTPFDPLLRAERIVIAGALVALTLLSWLYLAALADAMDAMGAGRPTAFMALMPMGRWGAFEFALCAAMWIVMMVAMMLPSAAPMLFTYHAVARKRPSARSPAMRLAAFLLGYLLVWTGFSIVAAALQWWLHERAVVDEMMVSASRTLDGVLFIAAGAWQLSPVKLACLSRCRTPLAFLLTEWRDGALGALRMGWRHGAACVGCCWALMALLFVGGVMNLLWIALLAGAVVVEKLVPRAEWVSKIAGVALCAAGVWWLAV